MRSVNGSGFGHDDRGSVALMFGLVATALFGLVAVAFDYSRAGQIQTKLQRAVDATVLYAAKNRDQSSDYTMSNATAARFMSETFDASQVDNLDVNVSVSEDRVRIDASGTLKTVISSVLGFATMPIASSAEARFGSKIEIALVLDNTGSMAQASKLDTLKVAAGRFVDKMQASASGPDAVKVALVPFDTDVNLGALRTSSWVDASAATFWASNPDQAGCIWDRDQPYDTDDTAPTVAANSFFADTGRSRPCAIGAIQPLTTDFTALHAAINGMAAAGNTNVTIGLVWGLHVLTPSQPITNAAPAGTRNVSRYMVFMTDGDNTQNRWTRNSVEIDARSRQVCDTIRRSGIQVFVARIMDGNADLLRSCATTPDMYYEISDVSQFDPVFTKIFNTITGMRLAR